MAPFTVDDGSRLLLLLLLLGQLSCADAGAAAQTCRFNVYSHTACATDPYRQLDNVTLGECCQTCTEDNQCAGFTLRTATVHSAHRGSCLMSLGSGIKNPNPQSKGSTCGTRSPLPGPSPAPGPSGGDVPLVFDCGARRLALNFADRLLGGRGQQAVFEALQIGPACKGSPPPPPPPTTTTTTTTHTGSAAPAASKNGARPVSYFVSPGGSDSAAGTTQAPWRTLVRVLTALAEQPSSSRPPTVVNLLPGVFQLNETLLLTNEHAGASSAAPVVWRPAPGAEGKVTISGGVDLSSLVWEPAEDQLLRQQGVWMAKFIQSPNWRFESLYAKGERQWRARWPNGNPEEYCARDLHGGNCTGYAQVGTWTVSAQPAPISTAVGGGSNVQIFARESGALIAEGTLRPLGANHSLTIATPNPAWHKRKATFSTSYFYEKSGAPPRGMAPPTNGSFQIDRYDTRFTKAFWNTAVPSTMPIRLDENFTDKTWANPQEGVVHLYQTEYWGIWMFQLESVNRNGEQASMTFSRGGWQEARGGGIGGKGGRGHPQDYFVENVFEELDDEREFYFNRSTSTLFWRPSNGTSPRELHPGELVAPAMETLVKVSADNVHFEGLQFAHALPTFMQPYEPTSGGDWAVHRGAATMIENATGVVFDGCLWRHIEGNGVMLSHYVRDSKLTNSEISGAGDTPVVLLGSADLMDGRSGSQPWHNQISHNYLHHFGAWGRQAAGYFEGLAGNNNVSYNVIHDGPRAGANFNDGFGGGLIFEGNLLFNDYFESDRTTVVQDTGEHGATNSWDRQPMIWLKDGSPSGELTTAPADRRITRNMVFRNSFRGPTSNKWCLDKDDGSSNYEEEGNVLLYGAIKDRDGLWRKAHGNLLVFPELMPFEDTTNTKMAMAYQVNGLAYDFFFNNTIVTTRGEMYDCGSSIGFPLDNVSNMHDNQILYVQNVNETATTSLPFIQDGCANATSFSAWQGLGFDHGSTLSEFDGGTDEILKMITQWLPL